MVMMASKRTLSILANTFAVAVSVLLLFLWLFPGLKSKNELHFHARLAELSKTTRERIPIRLLTDFPWTRLCPVDSYHGPETVVSASLINFEWRDSLRWFLYAPKLENQTALIFLTPDGIIPIKMERSRERYFQIDGPRTLAKHLCDHGTDSKLQIWNCDKPVTNRDADKMRCQIALW
jgi:hypothetical protein